MILLFNNLPVSVENKIEMLLKRAQELYGSNYYDIENENWLADKLTIESLFPNWIIKAAEENNSALVITIIKNYMRWLLSLEHGYGAQLDWENIRTPLLAKDVFLEAYADFYFPGADFSKSPLNTILPNIRRFSVEAENSFYNIKGTTESVKYVICNLIGIPWDSVNVVTTSPAILTIEVSTSQYSTLLLYQSFLEQYVIPAGISVIYKTI